MKNVALLGLKSILLILTSFVFFTFRGNAQTIYSGNTVKVGVLSEGVAMYYTGERPEYFKILINERTKTINVQSGEEKKSWITITYFKKEIDSNGDFLYRGCANYDGINPLTKDLAKCSCDLAIVNDRIMLIWDVMVFWYYRGGSSTWGSY